MESKTFFEFICEHIQELRHLDRVSVVDLRSLLG